MNPNASIPFTAFARFKRLTAEKPLLYCEPPEWAAASHAIVVGDTVHYLWAKKGGDNSWVHMHSSAPVADPTAVTHDQRNPILLPSAAGFDNHGVEYPFPFWNPADQRYYAYYLGTQGKDKPRRKQTGLLVTDGDFGAWTRIGNEPVVAVGGAHEQHGSSHPSVAVSGDVIQMVYTGESPAPPERRDILYNVPTICHATAPTSDPAQVTKNPANPVFSGSGPGVGSLWSARSRNPQRAELLPPVLRRLRRQSLGPLDTSARATSAPLNPTRTTQFSHLRPMPMLGIATAS